MKDPIQQLGSEIAVVIYDAPLPPRYYRFTKKFLKVFFVAVPLTIMASLFVLLIWGLGGRVKETPTPSLPKVLVKSDTKITQLESELESLKVSNAKLAEKLTAIPTTGAATVEEPFLMGIKKPYGMQILLSEKRISLDQFDFSFDSSKVSFKFQIINPNPESKVTGHILVFMLSEGGMKAYPAPVNMEIATGVKFASGEPFSVSRLRPTNAEFAQNMIGTTVKFMVYIFTREGDLLLIQESESYKVGSK